MLIGSVTSVLSFSIHFFIVDFLKSLFLPLILEFLFLPMIYFIALLNEYNISYNFLPDSVSNYSIYDVLNEYKINLNAIHRFNEQFYYKNLNNAEIVLNSSKSEFKLENNYIYMGDEILGDMNAV